MKDQYFGDKTDYIKHGVLRILAGELDGIGIHWTWTPDDSSTDGSRTRYLNCPDEWRCFDPPLFDLLQHAVKTGNRKLRLIAEMDVIPAAEHVFTPWTTSASERAASLEVLARAARRSGFVFLDPDNGLEVPSSPPGSKGSVKYVYFDEIATLWNLGLSVCVYQHFPRVSRREYVTKGLQRLANVVGVSQPAALLTSHVAFLCIVQPSHAERVSAALARAAQHWSPHVRLVELVDGNDLLERGVDISREAKQQELPL